MRSKAVTLRKANVANTSIGTAWIQVKPTTSGISSAIKQELAMTNSSVAQSTAEMGGSFSELGKKGGAALKVGLIAGATAAVTGTIALIKSATSQFAEYEQLVGGVDTLFKDASDTIQTYAAQAFETAQISANEYMSTVTSFSASLIQSLGGDTKKAAEYANSAIIDMADNANKMGTSMEMIQNAYQGFAKQNYTMLDNLKLGYGGTKTEMERLLADAEKLSGIHYEIGNFADMTAAIHVVQENLGIAGTSAKEASETVAGSLNAMRAAWANLITGMGDSNADIGALAKNFVDTLSTYLKNLFPVIIAVLENLANLIVEIIPMITEKLPALIEMLVPPLVNVLVQLALALIQNLPMIILTLLQGFVDALPALVEGIVGALPDLIVGIVDFLTNPDTIMTIIEAAVKLFMGIVEAIPKIIGALLEAFGKLFGRLWETLKKNFGEFVTRFGDFIKGIFKGAINAVLEFLENVVNAPIRLLNGFIGIINSAFGWIGVNIGEIGLVQLPRLAQGGIVDGNGTETSDSNLVALSKGEYVIRAAAAKQIGYDNLERMNATGETGATVNNYFTINGYQKDPDELANIISRKIALKTQGVLA